MLLRIFSAIVCAALLSACSDNDSVSIGLFSATTIEVDSFNDPQIPAITCHISSVKAHLSVSDPSNMAIACRQTAKLPANLRQMVDLSSPRQVFKESKSVLFKSLKVRRTFDTDNQTLIYLAYSTKETSGSVKNSISTVPLYGTAAFEN